MNLQNLQDILLTWFFSHGIRIIVSFSNKMVTQKCNYPERDNAIIVER